MAEQITRMLVGSRKDPSVQQLMSLVYQHLCRLRSGSTPPLVRHHADPVWAQDTLLTLNSAAIFTELPRSSASLVIALGEVDDPENPSKSIPITHLAARIKASLGQRCYFVAATGMQIPEIGRTSSVDGMVLVRPTSSLETIAKLLAHEDLSGLQSLVLPEYTVYEKKRVQASV